MSKRNYTHVQALLPAIQKMVESGMTQREIAEHYGFKDKEVVGELLKRARRKQQQAIPMQRGRKPAKTLTEYKYENKRLQMENELLKPIFQYGIIKERTAALFTDAIRAQILESVGYRTQILEFIDMEHTPKNLLIRAVKQGTPKDNKKELEAIMKELHIEPMLYRLLNE